AEAAALIRARYKLRLPDALQVAAAIQGGATLFLTNDGRIKKVEGIETAVLDDYIRQ
ncbi:MAG: PIN domain-containing protein, partial [Deltaproteobacteria bacterium]|nr:PIN domain-containing protein [Deltaproteobacteria bacterium]